MKVANDFSIFLSYPGFSRPWESWFVRAKKKGCEIKHENLFWIILMLVLPYFKSSRFEAP